MLPSCSGILPGAITKNNTSKERSKASYYAEEAPNNIFSDTESDSESWKSSESRSGDSKSVSVFM